MNQAQIGEPVALIDLPALASGEGPLRYAFYSPQQWLVAQCLDTVTSVIAQAHELSRKGAWCVGWVTYEAAPAFDQALQVRPHATDQAAPCLTSHPASHPDPQVALDDTPYALFAVFDEAHAWPDKWLDGHSVASGLPHQTQAWNNPLNRQQFDDQITRIQQWIAAGEVYQINLTTRLRSQLRGAPLDYFQALHRAQPASHAVYLQTPEQHVLCVSPELFFAWEGQVLTTQPMKGTAARGATPAQDQARAHAMRLSDKERAENLMIVDLLRNDLSRIAITGSVKVPQLFELHALPTVWQMSSTIQAQTPEHLSLVDIFKAIFPCGSITGAPKIQAMRRISDLEPDPRGVYCGAIGVMQPGGACRFAVPIRTVVLQPSDVGTSAPLIPNLVPSYSAQCGVGSGITSDATPAHEWQEWRHKQRFLERAARPFDLLESLRLEHGQLPLLESHLMRMAQAAAHFNFTFFPHEARALALATAATAPHGVHKLRLLSDASGQLQAELQATTPWPQPLLVTLAATPIDAHSEFVRFKTTQREVYAAFRPQAPYGDTLLWNAHEQLTEFTMGNVALYIDGQWLTPHLNAGLLPGTLRAQLLQEQKIKEADLRLKDIARAEAGAFINSVRGWVMLDCEALRKHT